MHGKIANANENINIEIDSIKMTKKYKYSGLLFWGLIIFGAVLPMIVGLAIEIIFDPKDLLNIVKLFFSQFISPWKLFNLLWIDIPFIIYAFIVRSLWYRPEVETPQDFLKHKAGVIGAGILTIGFVVYVNIGFWIGIVLHQPGASTSAIAYLFLPFYGIMTNLVGYGLGRLIGKIILHYKNKHL